MPAKKSRTCQICQTSFQGRRDAKTCSPACRKRLQRRLKTEAVKKSERMESALGKEFHRLAANLFGQHASLHEPLVLADERGAIAVAEPPSETEAAPEARIQSTALPREAEKRFRPSIAKPTTEPPTVTQPKEPQITVAAIEPVANTGPIEPAEQIEPAGGSIHLEDMMSTESLDNSGSQAAEIQATEAGESASSPQTTGSGGGRFSLFRYNKVALLATGMALLAIALISVGSFFLLSSHNSGKNGAGGNSPASYAVGSLPLGNVQQNQSLGVGEASQLTINGQLKVNKTLVLVPGSTPSSPVTGQIYYDQATNQPYYYNGSQFLPLGSQKAVTSLGGAQGDIGVGNGLSLTNGQLTISDLLQQQINTAISNNNNNSTTGVLSLAGTPNQVIVSAGTGHVTLSLPQSIAVSSAPTFGGLTVNGTLSVSTLQRGSPGNNLNVYAGSDNITFTANGRTFILPNVGPSSQTICTTGYTCATGPGVAVILQPGSAQADSGAGSSIFINNTGGGNLLQLQGAGTDSFVVSNAGNLTARGDMTLQGGDLTLGGSTTAGTVVFGSGAGAGTGTLRLGGTLPTGGVTYILPAPATSGTQTLCTVELGNCAGSGSGVTTLGGTNGVIAMFTGSQSIANSILSQAGTTLTTGGNMVINAASGFSGNLLNLEVNGTSKLSVNQAGDTIVAGNLTVNGTGSSQIAGGLSVGNGLSVTSGGASITGTTTITGSGVVTNTLEIQGANALTLGKSNSTSGAVVFRGSGGNGLLTLVGPSTPSVGNYTLSIPTILSDDTICTNTTLATACSNYAPAGGSGNYIQNQNASPQNANFNITGTGTAGTFTATTLIGNGAGITNLNGSNISSGTISNAYLTGSGALTVTAGTGLNGGGSVALGASTSLSVLYGSGAGTAVEGNTTLTCASGSGNLSGGGNVVTLGSGGSCNNITITNSPTFSGTLTIQGSGGVVIGVPGTTAGSLTLANGSSSYVSIIQAAAPTGTGNATFTLPSIAGGTTDQICTVSAGNCAGSGSGVTTPGGTVGYIPVFTGAQSVGNSVISQSGSAVNVAGTLTVSGSSPLALGTASGNTGSITFYNSANGNTLTLQAGATAGNLTLTLPTSDGANGQCLQTDGSGALSFQDCTGGAAGGVSTLDGLAGDLTLDNSSGTGSHITIDNASTSQKGIAQFNATNFTVVGGVVNTAQNIDQTASPVFVSPNATTGVNTGAGAGTQRIDASGNLVNIGTVTTSGAINGQTISSTANFTGTVSIQGANSLALGAASSATGSIAFYNSAGGNTITIQGPAANPGANYTLTIPTLTANDTFCLASANNCSATGSAGGDLSGSYPNPKVVGIQGNPVVFTSLTAGDVLQYDGTNIVNGKIANANLQGGTYSSITGVGNLTAGQISGAFGAISTASNIGTTATLHGDTLTAGSSNQFQVDASGNLTIANAAEVQGANGLQLGVAGTTPGLLSFANSTNSNLSVVQAAAPTGTGNATFTLPSIAGGTTDQICTVNAGNCAGSGSGVTTPGGTVGALAYFTGTQQISSSILSQSGTTLTAAGNLVVNAASGFTGNLINLEANTSSKFSVDESGNSIQGGTLTVNGTGPSSVAGTLSVGTLGTNGNTVLCSNAGVISSCSSTGGSSNFILNGTSPQTANFNITGNGTVGGFTDNGTALFKTTSPTAFQIQNSGGGNLFVADTQNSRVGINTGALSLATNLNVYNGGESTTQTDFTQNMTNAGINIMTDYLQDAYTAGLFWSTQNNNPTSPKAGIYTQLTNSGSKLLFGTSSSYTAGLTNTALTLGYNGEAIFRNETDTSAGFQVQNHVGTGVFTVNTSTGATLTSSLYVDTLGSSGNTAVCWNSVTLQLSNCGTGTGAPFVQGGNSFGATAVLGTNDNNGLNIRTNGTTVASFSNTGNLTLSGQQFNIQPSASLTAGQTNVTQTLTNASTSGGTVTGYNQNITVSNTTSASTTQGFNIGITDNTVLSNQNTGITVSISGTNPSRGDVGVNSSVGKGIALVGLTSGVESNGNSTAKCNGVGIGLGLCAGDTGGSNAGAGVYGYTGSREQGGNIYDPQGSGVYGLNQNAGGSAGTVLAGVKGVTTQTNTSVAYTSIGVFGQATAPSAAATAYGGYFTLGSGTTAGGAALYASNGSSTANILQLQDNTTNVFTVADGGAVTAANTSATAFRIQNSGGSSTLFTADTSNMRIQVGSAGTPTSQLFVSGSAPATATGSVTPSTAGLQDIRVKGSYAYVIDYSNNLLKVINISNPASMSVVGSVSTNARPQALAIAGNYAYVADDTGQSLDVINISNPASPVMVGSVGLGHGSFSIAVSGRYAYVGVGGGLIRVIDITNPSNPTLASTFSATGNPASIAVSGNYLYYADTASSGTFYTVNISNPTNLSAAGSISLGGQSACSAGGILADQNVFVAGKYAYVTVCSTNTVKIFDVSNPASPTAVGSGISTGASTGPMGINVQGRYAYVDLYNGNQFAIYDVSNPASPSLIGATSTGASSGPMTMAIQGRYAYVADWLDNKVNSYDLGGSYIQQFEAGGISTSGLSVNGNSSFSGDINTSGGLQVGQSVDISGNLGVGGQVLFRNATNSNAAFAVQNSAGTSALNVDTGNMITTVTAGTDAATLGSELFTGSTSFPATTGWTAISGTGQAATATHASGTTALSPTPALAVGSGNYYMVSWTITNPNSGGTLAITMGGKTLASYTFTADNSGTYSFNDSVAMQLSSTANLAFVPNAAFTGTVSNVSVKQVTLNFSPALVVKSASGINSLEVRTSTDQGNMFVGYEAGLGNANGSGNTALGSWALQSNVTGDGNTAVGTGAMESNVTGDYNTALGHNALQANTSGDSNVAIGSSALVSNIQGSVNVAIGDSALADNIDGGDNIAIGHGALQSNISSWENVAIGSGALSSFTGGGSNTAIGYASLRDVVTGYNNSAFGTFALEHTTGHENSAFGTVALQNTTTGEQNTAMGTYSLAGNTTGSNNVALGYSTLTTNTTGQYNTAIGDEADVIYSGLQGATAIGSGAAVGSNDTIILGYNSAFGVYDNVGIGTSYAQNPFEVAPNTYSTGTITQAAGSGSVVGSGTTFTANMVGGTIFYPDGSTGIITAYTNATHVTSSNTTGGWSASKYAIVWGGFNVNDDASVYMQNTTDSNHALEVVNTSGTDVLRVTTDGSDFALTVNGGINSQGDINLSNNNIVDWNNGNTFIQAADNGGGSYMQFVVNNNQALDFGSDGSALFDGASATFKNSSNSTSAFQIQNSSGASLLNVDSANSSITLLGNNSGQLGAWGTTNTLPAAKETTNNVIAYNGYLYSVGGYASGTAVSNIYYAKLNADGSTGTWSTNSSNPLPTGVDAAGVVAANGYIYVVGGSDGSGTAGGRKSTVYYARVNNDGSIGAWSTNSYALGCATAGCGSPIAREGVSTVVNAGYLYVMGGLQSDNNTYGDTYYAKLNPDGSTGAWVHGSNSFPTSNVRRYHSSVVANGYVYVVGGQNGSGTTQSTVYYAKLNANGGDTGSWSSTTAFPQPRDSAGVIVANGYLYVIGGENSSTSQSTVYYAPLNNNGTITGGAWSTNSYALGCATAGCGSPVPRSFAGAAVANGYVYVPGGDNSGGTPQTSVYYTSTSRLKVGGSLDLVGPSAGNLAEGYTGGTLTSGNTNIVGALQVQGMASFAQSVSVNGSLTVGDSISVGGSALFKNSTNSTSAFQIQNSGGTALLTADTTTNTLTVSTLVVSGNLTINGHIITGGATPTATKTANLGGTGSSCTVSGTDTAGTITLNSGSSGTALGDLCTITFSSSYGAAPRVIVGAQNKTGALLDPYSDNIGTTSFQVASSAAPTTSTTFILTYIVAQ